ncbi:MAG: SDR family oxidoreductase [Chloroflexi bacterium]|nr:SDR family oxidoreductase [Chloroflexota bacterium]
MDLGIAEKRVLVTGASQGLGREIAMQFARERCSVTVVARRADKLQELAADIGGEESKFVSYVSDLMVDGAPTKTIKELVERDGSFDIVVHNIGGTLNVKDPLSSVEEWCRVWRFNVGIAIEINAVVIPYMLEQQWGRVIHISSISAESVRGSAPYAAAKAYTNAYVKGLGRAIAPNGIVVSAIMPGAFIAEGGHWDNVRKNNPEIESDFLRHHHAVGRLGTPDEIAPFVLFMASQHVTFAQAATIPVDGGTM